MTWVPDESVPRLKFFTAAMPPYAMELTTKVSWSMPSTSRLTEKFSASAKPVFVIAKFSSSSSLERMIALSQPTSSSVLTVIGEFQALGWYQVRSAVSGVSIFLMVQTF